MLDLPAAVHLPLALMLLAPLVGTTAPVATALRLLSRPHGDPGPASREALALGCLVVREDRLDCPDYIYLPEAKQ